MAADSSRTTHGAAEAVECCQLFAELLTRALSGKHKDELMEALLFVPRELKVTAIAGGEFIAKS